MINIVHSDVPVNKELIQQLSEALTEIKGSSSNSAKNRLAVPVKWMDGLYVARIEIASGKTAINLIPPEILADWEQRFGAALITVRDQWRLHNSVAVSTQYANSLSMLIKWFKLVIENRAYANAPLTLEYCDELLEALKPERNQDHGNN